MVHASTSHLPPLTPTAKNLNLIGNDDTAFNRVLTHWELRVAGLAHRHADSGCEIEDMRQIGRLALSRALKKFKTDNKAAFNTFATTVIRNAMRDESRRNWVGATCGTDDEANRLLDATAVEYADTLVEREITETLAAWRRGLSERDRFIIEAVFYENCTLTAVAGRLGISVARVSQLIQEILGTARRLDLN